MTFLGITANNAYSVFKCFTLQFDLVMLSVQGLMRLQNENNRSLIREGQRERARQSFKMGKFLLVSTDEKHRLCNHRNMMGQG